MACLAPPETFQHVKYESCVICLEESECCDEGVASYLTRRTDEGWTLVSHHPMPPGSMYILMSKSYRSETIPSYLVEA